MPTSFFDGLGETMLGIFGETTLAVFKPKDLPSQSVEVIFSARHQEVDIDGRPYGAEKPVAWYQEGALDNKPKYDDRIEIDGFDYIIRETKFDGLELNELVLSEPV